MSKTVVTKSLVKAEDGIFTKNGKPHFLLSGEIHYFRLDPGLWEKHLRALKSTGANTVSTYICWDQHEYKEGSFDFTGETMGSRNIIGFIELCRKVGLDLIVKPGPYILAEYESNGLPDWLIKKADKGLARDDKGKIIGPDIFTYMSEEFLQYTFKWFDKIMPLIAKYQSSQGGPIVMMQVCNEVGIFQWLSGRIDVNHPVPELYSKFLKEKHGSIQTLNKHWGSSWNDFSEIKPPFGLIKNKAEYSAYYDFHLFYRDYFELYFETLINKIRSFGIDLQLTHNIPGWIYGQASELPMLISTYSRIMEKRKDVVFGLDHIPEFVSFRNAHSDLACNRILESMQSVGPTWAAEFQAGTREHHVRNYAADMEMFYMASLAHGLKGFNYYMFSQGINPEGRGNFGRTFYFQTPLDYRAKPSKLFGVVKKTNRFINTEQEGLLSAHTVDTVAVGLYKPYFYTELTTSQMVKEKRLDVAELGLRVDPRFMRESMFFDGVLRSLQALNYSYKIYDLENTEIKDLLKFSQLWVTATEFMDQKIQALLFQYVQEGGHLVIYPVIPTRDNYLNECDHLLSGMGIKISSAASSNKIDFGDIKDIFTFTADKQIYSGEGVETLCLTKEKEVCGIRKKSGKGWMIALGFSFGYTSDEHLLIYEKVLGFDHIKKTAKVSDPEIQCVVRKSKKREYLFLLNYHNESKTFTVDSKKHSLKAFSGKVIVRTGKR